MKKLLLLVFSLLASSLWAQTTATVTGTVEDLTGTPVSSGYVSFTLAPSTDTTISGTARFTPATITCQIVSGGQLENQSGGSCVITQNTALQPAGTGYIVDICPANTCTSEFFMYATSSSVNLTSVIPTPPQLPTLGGVVDTFSNESVGGNKTFTGTTSETGPVEMSGNGIFTDTQQNDLFYSAVGGINPATWVYNIYAGYSTDAFVGGILVPSNATVGGTDGLLGIVNDQCGGSEPAFTKCNATGVQGVTTIPSGIGGVNGAAIYGMNGQAQDSTDGLSTNSSIEAAEFDVNLYGAAWRFIGTLINGAGAGTIPSAIPTGTTGDISGAAAIYVMSGRTQENSSTQWEWPLGLGFGRAAVNGPAVQIDGTCLSGGAPCYSASITQTGYDSSNAAHTSTYVTDAIGDIWLTPGTYLGEPSNVIIGAGHLNPANAGQFTGTCSMSSSTSCTFTITDTYASVICLTNVQGTTAIAGACKLSGTTVTITAASSNSQTWGAILIGNPN